MLEAGQGLINLFATPKLPYGLEIIVQAFVSPGRMQVAVGCSRATHWGQTGPEGPSGASSSDVRGWVGPYQSRSEASKLPYELEIAQCTFGSSFIY